MGENRRQTYPLHKEEAAFDLPRPGAQQQCFILLPHMKKPNHLWSLSTVAPVDLQCQGSGIQKIP